MKEADGDTAGYTVTWWTEGLNLFHPSQAHC